MAADDDCLLLLLILRRHLCLTLQTLEFIVTAELIVAIHDPYPHATAHRPFGRWRHRRRVRAKAPAVLEHLESCELKNIRNRRRRALLAPPA